MPNPAMPNDDAAAGPPSPLAALLAWFRRTCAASEIDALGAEEMRQVAQDLRISVGDLRQLATAGDGEAELMRRMLALHGLDIAGLEQELPFVLRDMALTCARCSEKERCRHDLDHGAGAAEADAYCPNAGVMAALQPG